MIAGSGASSASVSPASASPLLLRCPQWASDVTPLPSLLESHIKLAKGPLPIGLQVEGAEKGVNGVVVAGLSRNGALAKDGRVKVSSISIGQNLILHKRSRNHIGTRRLSPSILLVVRIHSYFRLSQPLTFPSLWPTLDTCFEYRFREAL
mgnify:CR=1 FL=1